MIMLLAVAPNPAQVKWSLSGDDAGKFAITGTGGTRTLAFKANPDYEAPGDSDAKNLYEVTVVVTDTEGNTDEQAVMVKVTNIEEDGEVELSTLQPRVGFPVTATLTDPDNITADSVSWQWYRGATIAITVPVPTDLPANECDATDFHQTVPSRAPHLPRMYLWMPMRTKSLTAVATYTDGNANTGDAKDYAATATGTGNNVLANTINQAPVFPEQDPEMEGSSDGPRADGR